MNLNTTAVWQDGCTPAASLNRYEISRNSLAAFFPPEWQPSGNTIAMKTNQKSLHNHSGLRSWNVKKVSIGIKHFAAFKSFFLNLPEQKSE